MQHALRVDAKHIKEEAEVLEIWSTSSCIIPLLPLGAVGVAGVTLIVGFGIFEDEAVGALQPVGTFLHTVGAIFEVEAFYALVRTLGGEQKKKEGDETMSHNEEEEVDAGWIKRKKMQYSTTIWPNEAIEKSPLF